MQRHAIALKSPSRIYCNRHLRQYCSSKILIESTEPQLLLLDVELADGTSFDLLQSLDEYPFHIIFVTAYNKFAIKAIKFGALDYLMKPVDEDELSVALQKVVQNHTRPVQKMQLELTQNMAMHPRKANNRIVLRSQQYLQVVFFDEIIYCRSDGGCTIFYLTSNRKEVVSRAIKDYAASASL